MGAKAKEVRDRKCQHCRGLFEVDAKGIKAHARQCPENPAVWGKEKVDEEARTAAGVAVGA